MMRVGWIVDWDQISGASYIDGGYIDGYTGAGNMVPHSRAGEPGAQRPGRMVMGTLVLAERAGGII
jgi:hypothetical protein